MQFPYAAGGQAHIDPGNGVGNGEIRLGGLNLPPPAPVLNALRRIVERRPKLREVSDVGRGRRLRGGKLASQNVIVGPGPVAAPPGFVALTAPCGGWSGLPKEAARPEFAAAAMAALAMAVRTFRSRDHRSALLRRRQPRSRPGMREGCNSRVRATGAICQLTMGTAAAGSAESPDPREPVATLGGFLAARAGGDMSALDRSAARAAKMFYAPRETAPRSFFQRLHRGLGKRFEPASDPPTAALEGWPISYRHTFTLP